MSVFKNLTRWLGIGAVALASFGTGSFAEESTMPPGADYISKSKIVTLNAAFTKPPKIEGLVSVRTYHNRKDRILYLDVIVEEPDVEENKGIEIRATCENSLVTIICPNYIEINMDGIMQRGKTRTFDLLGKEKSDWLDLARDDTCRIVFGTIESYSKKQVNKDLNKVPALDVIVEALTGEARRKETEINEKTTRLLYQKMSDFHIVEIPNFVPKQILRKFVGYSHRSWRITYGTQEGIEIGKKEPKFAAVIEFPLVRDNFYQADVQEWVVSFDEKSSLEKYVLAKGEIPTGFKLADETMARKLYGEGYSLDRNPGRSSETLSGELKGAEIYRAFYSDGDRTLNVWGVKPLPGRKTPDKIPELTEQILDNEILTIYQSEKGDEYVLISQDLPRYAAFRNNEEREAVKKSLDDFYKRNKLKPIWRNKALDFDFGK